MSPPKQEEEKIPPCSVTAQPRETVMTQPMKSYYTSNFQFPPMASLFTTASPKSIKGFTFPLFLRTWQVVCH